MALNPKSFLLNPNKKVDVEQLLSELPNCKDKNHKQIINGKSQEWKLKYYQSCLLVEAKEFCSTMLTRAKIADENYQVILNNGDLDQLLAVIEDNSTIFFKDLIHDDLKRLKLYKGRMQSEIEQADSVKTILSSLKKYNVTKKLFNRLNAEYLLIKENFL